jgi:hypothetical protein
MPVLPILAVLHKDVHTRLLTVMTTMNVPLTPAKKIADVPILLPAAMMITFVPLILAIKFQDAFTLQ